MRNSFGRHTFSQPAQGGILMFPFKKSILLPRCSVLAPQTPRWITLSVALLSATAAVHGQTLPLWEVSDRFEYHIHEASVTANGAVRTATVVFSVSDPASGNAAWNIRTDLPYTLPGASLRVLLGWSTTDYQNTGNPNEALAPVAFGSGTPAAPPISINALASATALGDGRYQVTRVLPKQASGTAVVALEGHPMWPNPDAPSLAPLAVPVKSVYRFTPITDPQPVPRRAVVDFAKCATCHNGEWNEAAEAVIPRLTLHGANRTEEPGVCVICHNPNQTDVAYRTTGAEVSIDFKTMIHAIHGNKRREDPLVVIGRGGSINDYGHVEFPANPRDCFRCHIDQNGKGTYELPLPPGTLGTTIQTRSIVGSWIDTDPANNLRITPTAAVCSSCHDSTKALTHMASSKSGGAFGVLQSQINSLAVKENCVSCHGPGKDKSVRKVHR